MPTREKTAGRGGACNDRIRPYGSLAQAVEHPAHNRTGPGSRPGGTTRPSKQACHRDDRSHHPTACKITSPPLWLRRVTEREFIGVSAALFL